MALNSNTGVDASGDRDDNSIHEAKPDETHGEDQSLLDAAMLLSSGQSRKLEKSPSRESTAMPTNRRQSARLRSKACAPVPSNASMNMSPHKQPASSSKSKRAKEPASSLTGKRSNLDAVADPPKRQRTASHPSEQKESTQLAPERGRSSPSARSISPARSSTDEELSRAHGNDSSHMQRSSPAKSSRDEEKIAREHGDSLLGVPTIPPAESSRDDELIAQEHGDDLSDAQSDSLPSSPTKSTKPRKLIAQEHAGGFPDAQSSSPSSSPAKSTHSDDIDDFFHSLQNPPPEVIASAAARPRLSPPSRAPRPEKAATSAPEPALPALTSVREEVDVASQEDDNDTSTRPSTQASPQLKSRLLGLPAELRNFIWELALEDPNYRLVQNQRGDGFYQPALTRTCKSVREESLSLFFGQFSEKYSLELDLSIKPPKVSRLRAAFLGLVAMSSQLPAKKPQTLLVKVSRFGGVTFMTIVALAALFSDEQLRMLHNGTELILEFGYSACSTDIAMQDLYNQHRVTNLMEDLVEFGARLQKKRIADADVGRAVYTWLAGRYEHFEVLRRFESVEERVAKNFVVERLGGDWFRDAGFTAVWARARRAK